MQLITPRMLITATALTLVGVPAYCRYQETTRLNQERDDGLRLQPSPMDRETCLSLLRNPGARFHVIRARDTHYEGHPGRQESAYVDGRVVSGRQSCDLRITAEANMNHGTLGYTRGDGFTWYDRAVCLTDSCYTREFVGFIGDERITNNLTAGLTITFRLGVADKF